MPDHQVKTLQPLRDAITKFSESHSDRICAYAEGHRIITQGEKGDDCFLIKEGTVRILVREELTSLEQQITLRSEGDLIGEIAFFERNSTRTASVVVASERALLIRISRADLFTLMGMYPELNSTVSLLAKFATPRINETQQILKGHISVENVMMSVLLADIHGFSSLGEVVLEEHFNALLFDFLESTEEIVKQHGGSFEDQGDGFKILFHNDNHAYRCVDCAIAVRNVFLKLRSFWEEKDNSFSNMGLGIGICSDFISIRKRTGSHKQDGRILSHSINIAAAISKFRSNLTDTEIYIDLNTFSLTHTGHFSFNGPHNKWLEKIGRIYPLYRLEGSNYNETQENSEDIEKITLSVDPKDRTTVYINNSQVFFSPQNVTSPGGNMSVFDQRGQSVQYQYNAAGNINFGEVQNKAQLITELEKLKAELTKASDEQVLDAEIVTDAQYQITKAVQQAQKPEADKDKIVDHLVAAKTAIEGVAAAGGMVTALIQAAQLAQKFFG